MPPKLEEIIATIKIALSRIQGHENLVEAIRNGVGQLKDMTLTNPVSGACNLRKLQEIEKTLERRFILALDVDDLKHINEAHGHPYGTFVIKSAYQWIHEHTRHEEEKVDIIHPYGDEFFILLDTGTIHEANFAAQRLRQGFLEHTTKSSDFKEPVKFSVGIALFDKDKNNLEAAYELADKALWYSKNWGKESEGITWCKYY